MLGSIFIPLKAFHALINKVSNQIKSNNQTLYIMRYAIVFILFSLQLFANPTQLLSNNNDVDHSIIQEISFTVNVQGDKAIEGASVSVYNGSTILAFGKSDAKGNAEIKLKNFEGTAVTIKVRAVGYKYLVQENVNIAQGQTIRIELTSLNIGFKTTEQAKEEIEQRRSTFEKEKEKAEKKSDQIKQETSDINKETEKLQQDAEKVESNVKELNDRTSEELKKAEELGLQPTQKTNE